MGLRNTYGCIDLLMLSSLLPLSWLGDWGWKVVYGRVCGGVAHFSYEVYEGFLAGVIRDGSDPRFWVVKWKGFMNRLLSES
jgi:hypothetical protein